MFSAPKTGKEIKNVLRRFRGNDISLLRYDIISVFLICEVYITRFEKTDIIERRAFCLTDKKLFFDGAVGGI